MSRLASSKPFASRQPHHGPAAWEAFSRWCFSRKATPIAAIVNASEATNRPPEALNGRMRSQFAFLAALSLAALCACQSPATTPVEYVLAPPPQILSLPPLLPALKDRALAGVVIEEAAAFRQAMQATSRIDSNFADGAQVASAVRAGSAFTPRQLQRGAVALAAAVALSDSEFAEGFLRYSLHDEGRSTLARTIAERPDYAASFPGADRAAGLAIAELDRLGADAWRQGRAVQQAAYEVQRQPWSKEQVAMRDSRLQEAKALSAQNHAADASAVERLRSLALDRLPVPQISVPVSGPYTDVVNRGLAVAALAALGEAGEANLEMVSRLLDEPMALDCLQTAKLMYFQCLASADQGHYEDIFCLGTHAMAETGQCVVRAAGSPTPAYVPPPPPPPPAEPPKSKAKAKAPVRRPAAKRK